MSAATMEPVRLGVIGLGNFGRLHATTILHLGEARLVGVVETSGQRLAAFRQEHPGVAGWTDLAAALRESDAEAWVVATATVAHVEVAAQVLAAGKAALIEKPLATDLAAAQSLGAGVRRDSSNLMVGHVMLFNSEVQQLLATLNDEAGTARAHPAVRGKLRFIEAVRHRPAGHTVDYPGESPLHLIMVHDLYVVQALTRREEPVHFAARVSCDHQGRPDLALAWLTWSDGRRASFAASFLTPPGMPAAGFDRMEIFGDAWAARLQTNPRPLEWWDDQARWPLGIEITAGDVPGGMLARELRCFCRVVRGRQAVPMGATYHDALQVMGWLDHLDRAAREPC